MTDHKHPTRVIYHHDPASLPAELHAQYEVRQAPRVDTVRGPTVVIDGVSITGGPNPPASVLLTDTVAGDVGPRTLPVPLPDLGPGRLVRDDAACGWRFESAGRHLESWTGTATDAVGSPSSNRRCQDMINASRDSVDRLADLHDAIEAYASVRIERCRDCATDDDVKRAMADVDTAIVGVASSARATP